MLDGKLLEVLEKEGVVTIVTWGASPEPNAVCTWNSYVKTTEDDRLLIPVAGMKTAQENLALQEKLIIMLGSREVEGFNGYQGTGFEIKGTGIVKDSGAEFDMMKNEFSFMKRLLEVKVLSAKQLL